MECQKNLLPSVRSLVKIVKSRLMFITAFKFAASRVNPYLETQEKRNTTKLVRFARRHSRPEVAGQSSALIALQKQLASTAEARLKKQTIRTATSAPTSAAISTKLSCTLAEITWQRWSEIVLNAVSAVRHSRPMCTTLICLVDSKRLTGKGAITT